MKVVVTGAAGFIGSAIVDALLSRTDVERVIGIDSFTEYYERDLKEENVATVLDSRFTLARVDLCDESITSLLGGADFIFHEAGQPGVRGSWGSDFDLYTSRNILATQRLLEAARGLPSLRAFVYASSSSVYGNSDHYPTSELDLPSPVSPYGVSKLAAEHLCSLYAKNFSIPTVSLRYFTVFGPRQRPDMLFKRLVKATISGEPLEIFGDGSHVRDFTYIDDVVSANLHFLDQQFVHGSVFNVSGGTNVSVNEVVESLEAIAQRRVPVRYGNSVPGDVKRTGGSATRLFDATGWTPRVGLPEGLRSMWKFQVEKEGL
ncbi:NAD-dependent epimerase/dehydratase family protein [Gordonia alkanivorans]|uniref:NAD-dependent epimerase/dehydratase family protein n=1 Tax=Gordonia alkanivorans TaxID=84096 RepID=UPI0006867FF9|nr:NAD-dependent epimerase/dehydratase family protein [Gordonia alkanivorans]